MTESLTNPRLGLPSASSMQRIMGCKASLPLTNLLRRDGLLPVDHGSEDADTGTRIHDILASFARGAELDSEKYQPEEWDTAERLWERAQEIITDVFGEDLTGITIYADSEADRLWLKDLDGNPALSGLGDIIAVAEASGKALVIDYKTLFGDHPDAPENWQLKTLAVLVSENFPLINEVEVVLIQNAKKTTRTTYYADKLAEMLDDIDDALIRKDADPFNVGFNPTKSNCQYCPARLACPRLQFNLANIEAAPGLIFANATDAQIEDFLDRVTMIEPLAKAAMSEATARAESGTKFRRWSMQASEGKRAVKDSPKLADALVAAGVPRSELDKVMKVGVSDAEKLLGKATGLKGLTLKNKFGEIADGLVVKGEPEPKLRKVGM
jgi:hypothetical protein